MKKIIIFINFILITRNILVCLVAVKEQGVLINNFMPSFQASCTIASENENTCMNKSISQLINTNFFNSAIQNIDFLITNNFMDWTANAIKFQIELEKKYSSSSQEVASKVLNKFPMNGVFGILLSSEKINNNKIIITATLFYNGVKINYNGNNDGVDMQRLSTDSLILMENDKFELIISNKVDSNTVAYMRNPQNKNNLNNLKENFILPGSNYLKDTKSPKSLKLLLVN